MSKDIAISVSHVSKSFRLPTERSWGLKQAIFNRLRGIKGFKEQRVLRDINLEVERGEFVGIVGRNGSGKSTLLKILAGVYTPEKGSVQINGKLVPFIELGVGFNPELSGRENVYLNGALLGFSNKEVDKMYNEIVEFAELEEFMDQKLKNYSSGMQVRLAFSVAIRARGDILVLDEVLAVGDEAFQRKCFNYFENLKQQKQTVVLVTHSMEHVQRFCDKAIMIENGRVVCSGNPIEVANKYSKSNALSDEEEKPNIKMSVSAKLKRENGKLTINSKIKPQAPLKDLALVFVILRNGSQITYRWASRQDCPEITKKLKKGESFSVELSLDDIFPDGNYVFQIRAVDANTGAKIASFNNVADFSVTPRDQQWAEDAFWKISTEAKLSD